MKQHIFSFQISVGNPNESAREIKHAIVQRLSEERGNTPFLNTWDTPPDFNNDLDLNDPLYVYIEEFIKAYLWYDDEIPYSRKSLRTVVTRSTSKYVIGKVWISNFRQRQGTLEITFDLVVETLVYFGALKGSIDALRWTLESKLHNLSNRYVKIKFKKTSTKVTLRGLNWSFKVANAAIRFMVIVLLLIISYKLVSDDNERNEDLDDAKIRRIVTETVAEMENSQQAINRDTALIKSDTIN